MTRGVGAENEPGARFGFHSKRESADADAPGRAHLNSGGPTPDERLSRTGRDGTQCEAGFFWALSQARWGVMLSSRDVFHKGYDVPVIHQ